MSGKWSRCRATGLPPRSRHGRPLRPGGSMGPSDRRSRNGESGSGDLRVSDTQGVLLHSSSTSFRRACPNHAPSSRQTQTAATSSRRREFRRCSPPTSVRVQGRARRARRSDLPEDVQRHDNDGGGGSMGHRDQVEKKLSAPGRSTLFLLPQAFERPEFPHPVRWGTRFFADQIRRSEFARAFISPRSMASESSQ